MSPQPPVFAIQPTVQQYDWGKIGLTSKAGQFAKAAQVASIDESAPYAELWMGTHPKSPSTIAQGGQKLSDILAANTDLIGNPIADKFDVTGGNLPFLFKVLAIQKALSIQSHPDKATAERLHAEQPDIYKDPNHKPEMALALTPFTALCGFRPLAEISRLLACTPELARLTSVTPETLSAFASDESPGAKAALRTAFEHVASSDESIFKPAVEKIVARYTSESAHSDDADIRPLILSLNEQFPGDVGILCAYFLNLAHLKPGEAIFLGAGEPHAYVSGDIMECMANSDNVIRAGLTPKFRDIPNLIATLTYAAAPWSKHRVAPSKFHGTRHSTLYDPPIPEFSVVRVVLGPGEQEAHPEVAGPSIAILTEGSGHITWTDGSLQVGEGSVVFIGAGTTIELKAGDENTVVYRAFVEA